MEELATVTIHAKSILVKLLAQFCLEVGRNVCFLLQLLFSVGVRATRSKLAFAVQLVVPAELSLFLHLVRVPKLDSFIKALKSFLLPSSRSLTKRFLLNKSGKVLRVELRWECISAIALWIEVVSSLRVEVKAMISFISAA